MEENKELVESVEAEQAVPPTEETPAAEATAPAAEEPKGESKGWRGVMGLVASILAAVSGFFSVIFISFLGYSITYGGETKNYALSNALQTVKDLANQVTSGGDSAASAIGDFVPALVDMILMFVGMILAIVFFIVLLIKVIKHFKNKATDGAMEKTATTIFFLFVIFAVLVRSMMYTVIKSDGKVEYSVGYSTATTIGLAIAGVCFGGYVVCKVLANSKQTFSGKNAIMNTSFNLGWAVIAMVLMILVACGGAGYKYDGNTASFTFAQSFSECLGMFIDATTSGSSASSYLSKVAVAFVFSIPGWVMQVLLLNMSSKAIRKALNGACTGAEKVSLGAAIGTLIISVFFMIFGMIVSSQMAKLADYKMYVILPVFVAVVAVLELVVAIINKSLVKDAPAPAEAPAQK